MFSTDFVVSLWSRPFLLIVLATCAAAFSNKITLELKTELKLNRLLEFYLHCSGKKGLQRFGRSRAFTSMHTCSRTQLGGVQLVQPKCKSKLKVLPGWDLKTMRLFHTSFHLIPSRPLISSNPFQKTEMYQFSFEISWHSKSFQCLAPPEKHNWHPFISLLLLIDNN